MKSLTNGKKGLEKSITVENPLFLRRSLRRLKDFQLEFRCAEMQATVLVLRRIVQNCAEIMAPAIAR